MTSLDHILFPCFKPTKPGSPVKAFYALRTNRKSSCESDLISVSNLTNAPVAERKQIPAAGLQNPVERPKKIKLETYDLSRKCSITTCWCHVQVSTAFCQNGFYIPIVLIYLYPVIFLIH